MFVARKERTEPHGANESCHERTTGIRSFLRENAQNPGKKKMNKIMPFLNQIYPLNSYKIPILKYHIKFPLRMQMYTTNSALVMLKVKVLGKT